MKILAHRGRASPDMPGNTLDDFDESVKLGVDFIETDISLTTDGVPIIYHPGSTYPDCSSFSWNYLVVNVRKLPPYISWTGFLKFLEVNPKISIALDIKVNSPRLIDWVVERIILESLQNRIYLTTFQKQSHIFGFEAGGDLLIHAKKMSSEIKTHLIVTFPFNLPTIADKFRPDAISFGYLPNRPVSRWLFEFIDDMVDLKQQIQILKNSNIEVWGGIINTAEDMKRFADLGVDGIMTDDSIIGMNFKNESGHE